MARQRRIRAASAVDTRRESNTVRQNARDHRAQHARSWVTHADSIAVESRFLVNGQFTQARERMLRLGGEVVPPDAFARPCCRRRLKDFIHVTERLPPHGGSIHVLEFDFVPPLSLLVVAAVVCSDHGQVARHHVQAAAVVVHLAGVNNAGAH